MKKFKSVKHPEEVLLYGWDWAGALLWNGEDVGDTLIDDGDPDVNKHPTLQVIEGDAVIDSWDLVGTEARFWVSGGTTSTIFKATAQTAQGRKLVQELLLDISR